MPKLTNKRTRKIGVTPALAKQPPLPTKTTPSTNIHKNESEPSSKQDRVIAMLRSPAGTTITAVMKATGWQQHSVRGFLAGVVQKKLRLKLSSKKIDGNRIYRVVVAGSTGSSRRSA